MNNKYINIQCFNNLISNYLIEQEYNHTYCLKSELIINIFNFNDSKSYKYCNKCLEEKNFFLKCKKCSGKQIFMGLQIVSPEETLEEIINNKKSISRFGDGEFRLIFGISIGFQKANKLLSKRLKSILESNDNGILIGLPNSLKFEYLEKYNEFSKNYWLKFIEENKNKLQLFNTNKIYYSSLISRFYIDYKDKSYVSEYIKKLKKIWEQKDVLIIEGQKSRLGIGNDLFNNTKSIKRIICPALNAFNIYYKILKEALKVDKNKLILLALGPTATVLSYDLYKAGYQAIDIGHVDIEYEWYLRNVTNKIKIEGKYVNEVRGLNIDIMNKKDKNNYLNQIISVLR